MNVSRLFCDLEDDLVVFSAPALVGCAAISNFRFSVKVARQRLHTYGKGRPHKLLLFVLTMKVAGDRIEDAIWSCNDLLRTVGSFHD